MNILRTSARSRWKKEPGFFEVWYLTFNDSKTKEGYWIRFTLVVPKNVMESPFLNLWFTAFRGEQIISEVSENYKISLCNFSDEKIQISEAFLSPDYTEGEIAGRKHRIRWKLNIGDGFEFLHLPSQLYQIPLLHSYLASPNLSFEIKGTVEIDGEVINIDGRGTQSHIWGREMPDRWIWAHTDNFENHKGFMELISVETHLGPVGKVSSSRLFLRFDDEEFSFITLNNLGFRGCSVFPEYIFFATGRKYKIEGKLYSEKKNFVQYHYPMPSNKEIFCTNTEIGSLNIVVYKRDSLFRPFVYYTVLKNTGLAHFEFGDSKKNEELPVINPH
ncbi:MAG: hypothetical protein N3B13_03165 [Deltaproteobacteria bacterium]|nr:hypothetical protein [Deltaproteobacteria bacterium]